jgi:predicted ATPase
MHLKSITLHPERYPTATQYPFKLPVFRETPQIVLETPVTLFVGENGTGKSTLLEALAHAADIHIWRQEERGRLEHNPYRGLLCDYLTLQWADGRVPGSFFGAEVFRQFAEILEEWALADPGQLAYFGGRSLLDQSHGQSLMTYFRARYQIKGIYLLDEPETALSPRSQLELLQVITAMSRAGHAQFLIASHSPLLLACPGALIYSFDQVPLQRVTYEETEYYQVYKSFMDDRSKFL